MDSLSHLPGSVCLTSPDLSQFRVWISYPQNCQVTKEIVSQSHGCQVDKDYHLHSTTMESTKANCPSVLSGHRHHKPLFSLQWKLVCHLIYRLHFKVFHAGPSPSHDALCGVSCGRPCGYLLESHCMDLVRLRNRVSYLLTADIATEAWLYPNALFSIPSQGKCCHRVSPLHHQQPAQSHHGYQL